MNEGRGPQRIDEHLDRYRCGLDHYSLMLAAAALWTEVRKRGADAVGLAAFDTVIAYERGLISLPEVPLVPLPLGADATLRRVYRELHLLVRCRFFAYPCAPIPLTCRFVSVWCDITPKQTRRCVTTLEACGVFVRVGTMDAGKGWRMILWMPAGYDVVEGWEWPGAILGVQPRKDRAPFVLLPALLHRAVERVAAELDAKRGAAREEAATAFLRMYRRDLQEHRLPLVNVKTARTLSRRLGRYLDAVTAEDRLAA